MTSIKDAWSESGARFFHAGIDRGVYYDRFGVGHPWVGLRSVNERSSGGEVTSYFMNGEKYALLSEYEDYRATIEAYSAPEAFLFSDGKFSPANGLFITQQPRSTFDFSYRTFIGNDTEGLSHAYQIHLVYNAIAKPSEVTNSTITNNPSPNTFSWEIDTLPEKLPGLRSSAHIFIDTRYATPSNVEILESTLYGTALENPYMPTPEEVLSIFGV